MVRRSNNLWECEDKEELVSIGSRKLWISTSGPPRKANEPVILFFTGGGMPATGYRHLQQLLSAHWRVYFHDRSGYDRSERGSYELLTGQQSAKELEELLARIGVGPPYVLMGHSYGGIAARCFLQLQSRLPDAVRGLFLVDAATELLYELFPPVIPPPALMAVAKGVDWAEITHLREDMGLGERQWQDLVDAIERTTPGAEAEDCRATARALLLHQQFRQHTASSWPVLVMRCNMAQDFRKLYDAGVHRGQGTPEQRAEAFAFIEKMEAFGDQVCAAQLRLSSCHKYQVLEAVGHDDIMRRPEVYVDATRWIMDLAMEEAAVTREGR